MNPSVVIVDANRIFSAMAKTRSAIRKIIITGEYNFTTPSFAFVELFTHKEKLLKATELDNDELVELLSLTLEHITFLSSKTISLRSLIAGYVLCKDVDPKDFLYVALTLELDGQLWTGDLELKNGLIAKGFDRFFEP